jgi:hypothetical protein
MFSRFSAGATLCTDKLLRSWLQFSCEQYYIGQFHYRRMHHCARQYTGLLYNIMYFCMFCFFGYRDPILVGYLLQRGFF